MRHLWRAVLVGGMAVLVAVSCRSRDQVDPELVARAVEATLTASRPALVETPAPASTPSPVSAITVASVVPVETATPAAEIVPEPSATQTVPPIRTPTTPPTPSPTSAVHVVADRTVNLRAGPGTDYPVAGSMEAGARLPVTGRNADGSWFRLCCVDGQPVWVAASVVMTEGDTSLIRVAYVPPTPAPTATPVVPDSWLSYTVVDRSFSFQYPPEWRLMRENLSGADLQGQSGNPIVSIFSLPDPLPDHDETVASLVSTLSRLDVRGADVFRIQQKGVWADGVHQGAYVLATSVDESDGAFNQTLAVAMSLTRSTSLIVLYGRVGVGADHAKSPEHTITERDSQIVFSLSTSVRP